MREKYKRAFFYGLTAAAAVALGVFELVGEPEWWAGAIAIVAVIVGVVFGKPWKTPSIDE